MKKIDFDFLKYILSSPELKRHVDISSHNSAIARSALKNNNMDILIFLFESKELKENVKVDFDNYYLFRNTAKMGNLAMFKYLINHYPVNIHVLHGEIFKNACKNAEILDYLIMYVLNKLKRFNIIHYQIRKKS